MNSTVANDVYERYGIKWADFPRPIVPSAHSDEAELFCARQSMAVYAAYPSNPHSPDHDYIPSRLRRAIAARTLELRRMIQGGADIGGRPFEDEVGYRAVVSDQAGALAVWKENRLIIAFRGTANWQDWIHNFTRSMIAPTWLQTDGKYRLHKGFHGLATNLFPSVIQLIDEFSRARGSRHEVELTLCGHSLGGVLALNFASIYRHHWPYPDVYRPGFFPTIAATYTFGAPRLGTGEIWHAIVRPHYRLIVRGDPVPHTPPGADDDFQAAFLEKPQKPAIQPSKVRQLARAVTAPLRRVVPDFGAHDIEGYIDAITRKIEAKSGQP